MIFGSVEPLECYCAHVMLSEDEVYFTVLETKGSRSIYGPRPAVQVQLCFGLTSSLLTVVSPWLLMWRCVSRKDIMFEGRVILLR